MSDHHIAAIHLGCTPEIIDTLQAGAVADGAMTIRVDVGDVTDMESLLRVLGQEFQFPDDTWIDGAIDYLSDLSWLGSQKGYLVIVEGLDRLLRDAKEAFDQLIRMLPWVIDRCRTAGIPYHVALAGVGEVALHAHEIVETNNQALVEAAQRYPWLHDVKAAPVVDHRNT